MYVIFNSYRFFCDRSYTKVQSQCTFDFYVNFCASRYMPILQVFDACRPSFRVCAHLATPNCHWCYMRSRVAMKPLVCFGHFVCFNFVLARFKCLLTPFLYKPYVRRALFVYYILDSTSNMTPSSGVSSARANQRCILSSYYADLVCQCK